ncbi:MAG: hypothetical protein ACYTDW_03675 [Planctomycetota bacterium]
MFFPILAGLFSRRRHGDATESLNRKSSIESHPPRCRSFYGNCSILEPNFAPNPDGKSDYGNPYFFTGRRVDILDNGGLKIGDCPNLKIFQIYI